MDMSTEAVENLIKEPLEKVIELTKEELKDYADDVDTLGFSGTVDKINNEIREQKKAKAERKK